MIGSISPAEEAQLMQTIEMFEVITQSQSADYQSLEILKEAYLKLGRQKDVINTSKRIAQAYMSLGQLSSAILEYETILQRYPEDPDVLAAIAEIESKANSLTAPSSSDTDTVVAASSTSQFKRSESKVLSSESVDDGREAMQKLFVDGRHLSLQDFDLCWPTPPLQEPPGRVIDPLVQVLADRAILPADKSLKVLVEKTRLAYMPLEKYDIDLDAARSFPKEVCQRWCVLPFDRMSKSVFVATLNPFNQRAVAELQAAAPYRIIWYLAHPAELIKGVRRIYR